METTGLDAAWKAFEAARKDVAAHLDRRSVVPRLETEEIRRDLDQRFPFQGPVKAAELVEGVAGLLRDGTVHVTHPRYFGLFNPPVRPVSVLADALAALYNPQLAAWSHAPAANEIERHTLGFLASKLGLDPGRAGACFATGGAEANATAVLTALAAAFPAWKEEGVRALPGQPKVYVSREAHHSFQKAVTQAGLGASALREVEVDSAMRLDPAALERALEEDRQAGHLPFLVVGTAGTTGAGIIDPLPALASLASARGLRFHVDAAYGGFARMSRTHAPELAGIERADSITWDAHKGLAVPMGAGMFFCRDQADLARTFSLATGYMPPPIPGAEDPYTSTVQWSRRFIGLKVFMALAELGEKGWEELVDAQFRTGRRLRDGLASRGWEVVNDTPLPVVCFTRPGLPREEQGLAAYLEALLARGKVWISKVRLPERGWVLRACITSYRTDRADLEVLLSELEAALE